MCKWVLRIYTALYVFALILLVVGMFGLFGQPRDPLAGVFLIPLGLPWNQFVDLAPEPFWPWLAAAAPLVNIVLIGRICRWAKSRRS